MVDRDHSKFFIYIQPFCWHTYCIRATWFRLRHICGRWFDW